MSYFSYDWYISWYNWYYQINEPIIVDVVAKLEEPSKVEPSKVKPSKIEPIKVEPSTINIAHLETLQESFPPRNKNKKKKKKLKSWRD